MYSKISKTNVKYLELTTINSLKLNNNQKIKNIEPMSENRLLIVIDQDLESKAIIYDLKQNKIIYIISR